MHEGLDQCLEVAEDCYDLVVVQPQCSWLGEKEILHARWTVKGEIQVGRVEERCRPRVATAEKSRESE